MLNISGYATGLDEDTVDEANGFTVNSCGHYMLIRRDQMRTVRERGRRDYQLLYVANGLMHCTIDGRTRCVEAGEAVLYPPGAAQDYVYFRADSPDIYWLHFSGNRVDALLHELGIHRAGAYSVGSDEQYGALFNAIIRELQLKRPFCPLMAAQYAQQLLALMARGAIHASACPGAPNAEVERAIGHFNRHYNQPIGVREYAEAQGMSACWFIRSFKHHTGVTPHRYLLNLRMHKACELLTTTRCDVGEVAAIVGFSDPLYFSRCFRREMGCPPGAYRAQHGS